MNFFFGKPVLLSICVGKQCTHKRMAKNESASKGNSQRVQSTLAGTSTGASTGSPTRRLQSSNVAQAAV